MVNSPDLPLPPYITLGVHAGDMAYIFPLLAGGTRYPRDKSTPVAITDNVKVMKAVILFVSAADEHAFITPEDISPSANFLNIEIMLVAALDILIDGYSATGTVTSYPRAVRLVRMQQTTAASAEYQGANQG